MEVNLDWVDCVWLEELHFTDPWNYAKENPANFCLLKDDDTSIDLLFEKLWLTLMPPNSMNHPLVLESNSFTLIQNPTEMAIIRWISIAMHCMRLIKSYIFELIITCVVYWVHPPTKWMNEWTNWIIPYNI